MKENIVAIVKNELRAGTWILSKGFKAEHRALKKLVVKYKSDFEEFGIVTPGVQQLTEGAGRPVEEFLLNEQQSMYLGTLLTNTATVRDFKKKLVKEFGRMKNVLTDLSAQRQNAQWLETRNSGKPVRRIETDTVKKFVEYAISQGSKNAGHYYSNITSMQNKALFLIEQKFKNIRDILNLQQLSTVICADEIVTKALDDGMAQKMKYQDIYQLAKKRIELFAEVHGKTLIPNLSGQKKLEGK